MITEYDAILVNVGATDVKYNPMIAKVTLPTAPYTTMSYRIIKSQNDPKVFAGTAKETGFASHVMTTLKAEWLSSMQKPWPTFIRKVLIQGEETIEQWGLIHVKNDKVDEVFKRSGHNGATIWHKDFDHTTSLLHIPRKTLLKEAIDLAKRTGDNSRGVVYRKNGTWAVRVPKDESIVSDARAKLDPSLTEAVGPMMTAPYSVGCMYVLKGLPTSLTYTDVANIMKKDIDWKVRPERFAKSSNNKSNTMVVFAIEPPAQNLIQINNTAYFIQIEPFLEKKAKSNKVDKIFDAFNSRQQTAIDEHQSYDYDDEEAQEPTPSEHDSLMSDLDDAEAFAPTFVEKGGKRSSPYTANDTAPKTIIGNAWERRAEAISATAKAKLENDKARSFWQPHNLLASSSAAPATAEISKTSPDKDLNAKDLDNLKTVMMNRSDVIKKDNDNEFQRLQEQLKQQNLENERKIQEIIESQKESNASFKESSRQMDEKMNGLFSSMNTSFKNHSDAVNISLNATNASVADMQGSISKMETMLAALMARSLAASEDMNDNDGNSETGKKARAA